MARTIKDVTIADYHREWWTRPAAPVHNLWWDGDKAVTHVEQLSNGQYRVTLTDASVKVCNEDVTFWLETY